MTGRPGAEAMRNPTFLDHLGGTRAGFLHAHGERATSLLLDRLALAREDRVLDIGCGTGATLVACAARMPGAAVSGAEASAAMLDAARRRLRFCGLARRIDTVLLPPGRPLPFADGTFTKILCESVLAIQDPAAIRLLLADVVRLLAPGGLFLANETIWTERATREEIARINAVCRERFGIVQSSAEFPRLSDWTALFAEYPLSLVEIVRLDGRGAGPVRRRTGTEWRSRLFTLAGKLRSRLSPGRARAGRRFARAMAGLAIAENTMEGVIFVLRRT